MLKKFNGATGVLRRINMFRGQPGLIYLELDDPSVGKITRSDAVTKRLLENLGHQNWTPIKREKRTFNVTKNGLVQVSFENFWKGKIRQKI